MRTRTSVSPLLCLSMALCAWGFSACTTAASTPDKSLSAYMFPTQGRSSQQAQRWFTGEGPPPSKVADKSPEARYISAEELFWKGYREAAFDVYLALLKDTPSHPLARHATERLYSMRSVTNHEAKLKPVLSALKFSQVHPMTAVNLSLLGQHVHHWMWRTGQQPIEFKGDAVGLPNQWMISPQISPWRLMDFDQPHPIERQESLQPTYLSPSIAKDVPANYKARRPFITSNTKLAPRGFVGDGVYYMETFAHVEANAPQVYWVHGNFPAQSELLIDGVKVLERREENYGTATRMRRIELSPGKHRVLLKMALQKGYRDSFDLMFLNAQGGPLSGSMLRFEHEPGTAARAATPPRMLSAQTTPAKIEWTLTKPKDVKRASDMSLYLTALTALKDRESAYFDPAIDELVRRNPTFAPAYGLKSEQVQTLWEVPSQSRNTAAIKWLRKAAELDPDSLHFQRKLAMWLKRRGKGRDIVKRLEANRDAAVHTNAGGHLMDIRPLEDWATYVQDQGWKEDAENAWKAVLKASPNNCNAASRLQQLYYERKHTVEPSSLVKDVALCPTLSTYWVRIHPEKIQEQLALAKLQAQRLPYSANAAKSYATVLRRAGKPEAAHAELERAKGIITTSQSIRADLVDDALARQGVAQAQKVLSENIEENGHSSWANWRMATLERSVPLTGLMQDGIKVVKELTKTTTSAEAAASLPQDEAYYAIDFAAKRYFKDGSGISLTHTMVRVMTKGAIDQHGEVSIPSGAKVIVARTIKKDGSTREPEYTSGKSTLSMPGLAEGDFVELAYIQSSPTSKLARTHNLGTKFFFRMQNISSLHSEYVVINPPGDFLSLNNAPKAQRFEYKGEPAVRFVQKRSPKPASERSVVNTEEFLPWVQMVSDGVTLSSMDRHRKTYMESIKDNTKDSVYVRKQLARWKNNLKGVQGAEKAKRLFYDVMSYVPTPDNGGGFTTDISHVLVSKEGSPFLLLYKAFQDNGIPVDIFLVKNKFQVPEEHPLAEASKYTGPVMRVTIPQTNEVVWLQNLGKWSMFGSMANALLGQSALCVTCDTSESQTLPEQAWRPSEHKVAMNAQLNAQGALIGSVRKSLDGIQGTFARDMVSRAKEETKRKKLISSVLSTHIQGASIKGYTIENAEDLDKPLILNISFERPQFARATQGALVIEKTFFREPVASMYATLPSRTIPLFASYYRNNLYSLTLTLPKGKQVDVRSKQGKWNLSGPYGKFERSVGLNEGVLTINSTFQMPIQRVPVAQYKAFQEWAIGVERSGLLLMVIR